MTHDDIQIGEIRVMSVSQKVLNKIKPIQSNDNK